MNASKFSYTFQIDSAQESLTNQNMFAEINYAF